MLMFLLGISMGIAIGVLLKFVGPDVEPYKAECPYCPDEGKEYKVASEDPVLTLQILDSHIRDAHLGEV